MILTALLFGLLGSFHCVGMCGPIAFLMPVDRSNAVKRVLQILSYHSGRLLTYATLGFILGSVGKRLQLFGLQQQLSIAVGVLMILAIALPAKTFGKYNFSKPIYKLVGQLKTALGYQLKSKKPGTFFTLGLLNGMLPCGLVYMAVFGALATGSSLEGGLYMLFFGLGTLPLMTTAIYLGNFLKGKTKQYFLKAIPVLVVLMGCLFILRGLGLGIPYVSPSNQVTVAQVDAQHSCH
ncbi:sulfite exporter TauE/SafE family protein [Leeuwenhoekiella marinoflava]|uniref:sulfite exporter TauE/SafE family protein n=1 Tax=Leeuwenhoekiella marinoflava TaxID=988 RepID=UPI00300111E8